MVCSEGCFYDGRQFTAGRSVVLSDHPVVRRLPECFEQLDPSNPPERNCTLAEELEFRTRRKEELDRHTARERMRERARRVQDEGAFWRETAEFLAADEAMRIDDLADPAAEIEEEALIQEQRIARLPDPDGQRFWDETLELLQREAAQRIFPDELRRADGEG